MNLPKSSIDAVIIGSGAWGRALAFTLSSNDKKVLMLSPENYNDYYDYLFVISNSKDILPEEDFLMKNLGFFINCELDFRNQDLDELVFENYPLL